MTKATVSIRVFLTIVVVASLFTLNALYFHSMNLSDEAGLEQIATSSFEVYMDGRGYFVSDSVSSRILYQGNNCTAIVRDLLSIIPEGGCITFKAGVYPCDIVISKKLSVSGEGRAATVIQGTIALDSTIIDGTPRSHHVLIQNLGMDGQNRLKVGIKYESPLASVPLITIQNVDIENYTEYGAYFINASDCVFDNVVIGNCAAAIRYTTGHNFGRIINCELLNYRVIGLYTDAQIYLSGTVFSTMQNSPTVADLVLDNAFGTVTGCWFENNRAAPYAPCIDMPNTCYRPLAVVGCFFANEGGDIIRIRNAFSVSMTGNFFSQQTGAGNGCCVHVIQGVLYWGGNQLDPASSSTLSLFQIENGAAVKFISSD